MGDININNSNHNNINMIEEHRRQCWWAVWARVMADAINASSRTLEMCSLGMWSQSRAVPAEVHGHSERSLGEARE